MSWSDGPLSACVRDLLDRKIAVKEVGQDLQKISNVLLEGGEEVADKGATKVSV